jgi:acyl-coenzyme A thioesterase PaaI-like protein
MKRSLLTNYAPLPVPTDPDTLSYTDIKESHCNCIVCGHNNPISLGLKFEVRPNGSVGSLFKGSSLFQGYQGMLHGGIIAALLDSAMTHCLFHHGIRAVTGDLQVRFVKPVPFNSLLDLRASLILASPPLFKLDSTLISNRQIMARGKATFMET